MPRKRVASPKAASSKPARGERRHVPKPSDDSVRKAGIVSGWKGWIKSDYEDRIFKVKEGKHRIRLLAWADGRYFGLQLREHRSIRQGMPTYLCMQSQVRDGITLYDDLKDVIDTLDYADQVSNKCPICEDIYQRMRDGAKAKDIKDLRLWPTPRTVYLMVDRNEEEKGVQIWPAPYFKIDEEIRKRVIDPQDGSVLPITDPEVGYDIYFDMEIEKTSSGDFPKYTGVQVARKPSELDISYYDDVFDLRDMLIIPTYDEIADGYFGSEEGGTTSEVVDETKDAEWDKDAEKPSDEEVAPDTQEEQDAGQGTEDDCFGKAEHYGKYQDCDDSCPDREECKAKVEEKKAPPEKPNRPTRPVRK